MFFVTSQNYDAQNCTINLNKRFAYNFELELVSNIK